MINKAISITPLALFFGLNFAAGYAYFKKRKLLARGRSANAHYDIPLSIFSNADHPELLKYQEDVNPLTEAEIYVIYGRKQEAQEVLDSGLLEGLITPEDIDHFWRKIEQETVRRS
jgi:hypothetical protein